MPETCKLSTRKIAFLTCYVMVLFGISLIPMDREIRGMEFLFLLKPAVQNLLHIPLFMLLSILLLKVIQGYDWTLRKRITFALVVSSFIGIMNECIQIAVPGRYPSMMDVTFNLMGVVLGVIVYFKLQRASDSFLRRLVCQ